MDDVASRVRELARVFAGGRLPVMQALCRRGHLSLLEFDGAGRRTSSGRSGELFALLGEVEKLLRPAAEQRWLVIELRLDGAGGYEFRHTFELDTVSPTQLVLDPDHRHPGHPRHPMPAPAGVAVVDRPTDPTVLATVRGLVDEFVARHTARHGRPPEFDAGYSEEEILAAESALGLRLPEDLRALYRTVRDDSKWNDLLGGQSLLPLDEVVAEHLDGVPGSYGWDDDLFTVNPVVFESYPAGRVRRISRSDWWVTIATDCSGNWWAVDLDPAPQGTPGQVIEYGRDLVGPVGYRAESVSALLRHAVDALAGGTDHGPRRPVTGQPATVPPDTAGKKPRDRVPGVHVTARYSGGIDLGDRPVEVVVAGFDDPLAIQALYLNKGDFVDLAGLAPLGNLRRVSINHVARVDLALPHQLPVEALSVDATVSTGLAGLAGHPTLWQLRLRNLTEPVSVAPLATLPALSHLDLSAVEVTDLHLLATLPRLRVLELNDRQWRYLRDHGGLPAALAGAVLSAHTSLLDALDWSAWLRGTGPVGSVAAPVSGTLGG
ncbi:SMI1/KNR4 family protein [Plantactinospora sonchi]|uniref:SMI1/KNR4 family protein n=1 Tax=Plantactinospora sonchi TaxID=1544735 RepID=A0ABU7RSS8_9ACTN